MEEEPKVATASSHALKSNLKDSVGSKSSSAVDKLAASDVPQYRPSDDRQVSGCICSFNRLGVASFGGLPRHLIKNY
jgi:hypothetical protein